MIDDRYFDESEDDGDDRDEGRENGGSGGGGHTDSLPHIDVPLPPHVDIPEGGHSDHGDVHTDHGDSENYYADHSDTNRVYVDTTIPGVHQDVNHNDHNDHIDTYPIHTNQTGRTHQDHLDAVTFPRHIDVAPPHIDSPPARDIKVWFDPPGGPAPDIVDFLYKRGQEGNREKSYRVINLGEGTMKMTLHNIPRGVEVNPEILTIPPNEHDSFVVTVTREFFEALGIGITERALDIRMELIGEPIRP